MALAQARQFKLFKRFGLTFVVARRDAPIHAALVAVVSASKGKRAGSTDTVRIVRA